MSCGSSVRLRFPFLGERVTDVIFTLPYEVMNYQGIKKYLIKEIASRFYNREFAYREKIGLSVPNRRWFKQRAGLGLYGGLLLEERTTGRSFYNGAFLRGELKRRLENDNAPLDYLLWSVLNLELWIRLFIEGDTLFQGVGKRK